MESNKLESITRQLFEEGLSKGRSEGERLIADAEARAKKIVADAENRASEISRKAHAEAEELRVNTLAEVSLAGRQAVAKIKSEIAGLITARSVESGVRQANLDPAFVKEMLLSVAKNWQGSSSDRATLLALLPEGRRKEMDSAFEKGAAELLAAGVEVGYGKDVRSGFRVVAKGGGYYIDFSNESFEALLGEYLREKAAKILYGK